MHSKAQDEDIADIPMAISHIGSSQRAMDSNIPGSRSAWGRANPGRHIVPKWVDEGPGDRGKSMRVRRRPTRTSANCLVVAVGG